MSHNIAQALREQLKDCHFDYGDAPANSVIEFLYVCYSEISRSDPKEINEGFAALEQFFEGRCTEESTEMFPIHCLSFLLFLVCVLDSLVLPMLQLQ